MTRHERLLDNYEDALFALLMEEAMEEEGIKLLEENERLKNDPGAASFADLDKRCIQAMNRAFRKERLSNAGHTAYRVFRQVAVFVLAAAVLFTTAFAASETVRVATLNFISKAFFDHMEIRPGKANPPVSEGNPLDFEVGWLPEGFELLDSDKTSTSALEYYTKSTGGTMMVSADILNKGSFVAIDTENAEIENIIINGLQAQIITKDYINIVIYIEEYDCVISVTGVDVSRGNLIKVAENITF